MDSDHGNSVGRGINPARERARLGTAQRVREQGDQRLDHVHLRPFVCSRVPFVNPKENHGGSPRRHEDRSQTSAALVSVQSQPLCVSVVISRRSPPPSPVDRNPMAAATVAPQDGYPSHRQSGAARGRDEFRAGRARGSPALPERSRDRVYDPPGARASVPRTPPAAAGRPVAARGASLTSRQPFTSRASCGSRSIRSSSPAAVACHRR